jgi:hypothetical protein
MFLLFFLFFPIFLAIFALLTIFGNVHRPCKHYSIIVSNSVHYVSSFFPDFLAIFGLITIFGTVHRPCKQCHNIVDNSSCLFFFSPFFLIFWLHFHYLPYLEMCTDHVNSTLTRSPHHSHFFLILSLFFIGKLTIFALLTIFGSVHRPCKQCPNIVKNSLHHVYYYFSFFPEILTIFSELTIFGNAHRPCKQYPNKITTPSLFFLLILLLFFILKCKTCHIWQFLVFIPVTEFRCHSVPVHSGDCSGLKTGITKNSVAGVKIWLVNSTGMSPESTGMTRIRQESVGHH